MHQFILKEIFYNWLGYNELLFIRINSLVENKLLLQYFQTISELGSTWFIPVYFAMLFALAALSRKTKKHTDIKYARAMCVLFFGFIVGGVLIDALKTFFAYTRPLCMQNLAVNTYILSKTTKCFESFPSGHASAVALAVSAFWPVLNIRYRILAIIMLISVMIARILKAAHYPADVLYGAIIGYLIAFVLYRFFDTVKATRIMTKCVQKILDICKISAKD